MHWTTKTRWQAGVAAAALFAAGAVVVLVTADEPLPVGFVTKGSFGGAIAHEVDVQLPMGVVHLTSGEPRDELPAQQVGRSGEGSIPTSDGASILPISWTYRPSLAYDDVITYPSTFSLVATSEGERTDPQVLDIDLHRTLETSSFPGQDLLVVVAGDGDDLGFEVTYEGETQTVAMASEQVSPGRAAALYPDGETTYDADDRCDARGDGNRVASLSAGNESIHCMLGPLVRTPYLPDRGWAEPGRVWSVVALTFDTPRRVTWIHTGTRYRVDLGPVTVSLPGSTPVRQPRTEGLRAFHNATWVFDSPDDLAGEPLRLHLTAPMTATRLPRDTGGPTTVRFGVDHTFALRR